jgi:hypothetical protein
LILSVFLIAPSVATARMVRTFAIIARLQRRLEKSQMFLDENLLAYVVFATRQSLKYSVRIYPY